MILKELAERRDVIAMSKGDLNGFFEQILNEKDSYILDVINEMNKEFAEYGFIRFKTIEKAMYILYIVNSLQKKAQKLSVWKFLMSVYDSYNHQIEGFPKLIVKAYTNERLPIELRDKVKGIFRKYGRKAILPSWGAIVRYHLLPKYVTLYRGGREDEAALNGGEYWWSWTPRYDVACSFAYHTKEHVGKGVVYKVRIRKDEIVCIPYNNIFECIVLGITQKSKVKVVGNIDLFIPSLQMTKARIIRLYFRMWKEYLFTQPVKALFSRFKRLFKN